MIGNITKCKFTCDVCGHSEEMNVISQVEDFKFHVISALKNSSWTQKDDALFCSPKCYGKRLARKVAFELLHEFTHNIDFLLGIIDGINEIIENIKKEKEEKEKESEITYPNNVCENH